MYNVDPNRAIEEILSDIRIGATQSFQSPMGTSNPGAMWAPFAALLVRLSRDAEATAVRMELLTRRLYILTIALLALTFLLFILTLGLFAKEAFDFYKEYYLHEQSQPGPPR
jgi:hypothetical protein